MGIKLISVLENIKKITTDYQKDYWKKNEYIIYCKAEDLDITILILQSIK
jgi:hypothetical protein